MKKSQISIQFAWIFILIAGAIILIFFISLVYKQKEVSEIKLSAGVLTDLDAILTGAELSSGTSRPIDTPNIELNFICDEEGTSRYELAGTTLGTDTPSQIVFAPDTIKGKKIVAWALDFNTPFKTTFFLYLSDPNIKYVLINPQTSFADEVKKTLPEDLTTETVQSISNIQTKGFHKIRLIFFRDELPLLPAQLQDEELDVSAVKISPETSAPGTISFYKRSRDEIGKLEREGSLPYIDKSLLYGAIYSQDMTFYECNLKKAIRKLNLVAKVYSDRENALKEHFTLMNQDCKLFYLNHIQDLVDHSEECSQNIESCMLLIKSDIEAIRENQNTLIRRSCPLLY